MASTRRCVVSPRVRNNSIKGGVHPKMITSYIVVFGALSRLVKVRSACDKPFWIYQRLNNCAAPAPDSDDVLVVEEDVFLCAGHAKEATVLPRLSVPRLSETSNIRTQFRTWSLCKKMVFSLKSQTLRLSRVHVFVCHAYMFNVGTQWYVIVYSVKCKGLQTRPSYIFLCYNSMYIARKVSFG